MLFLKIQKYKCVLHLDKERGHPLAGVVVARDGVDHPDGVDEPRDGLQHAHGVAVVQRVAELLQGVQELHVVLGLVSSVRDAPVQLLPGLDGLRLGSLGIRIVRGDTRVMSG